MSSAAVPAPVPAPPRQAWARFTARHPAWWVVAIAATACTGMLAGGSPHHHGGSWALMVAATMLPVFAPRARRVARASVGRVRNRAVAETLAGYLVVWLALGAGVLLLPPASSPGVVAAVWLAATAWQRTVVRYRALNRCHAVGVPAGTRDGRRRVQAGMAYGAWCGVTCGPAMIAAAVTGLPPVLMPALAAALLAERIARRPRVVSLRIALAMLAGALGGGLGLFGR